MGSLMVTKVRAGALFLAALTATPSPAFAQADGLRLQLTGQGRFTYFGDLDSVRPHTDGRASLRALQLNDEPMQIGDKRYLGGWSLWAFDCDNRSAQRLDFQSLTDDGQLGPATPTRTAPYPLAAGGDAAELAAVACRETETRVDARTLTEAIALAADND